MRFPFCFSKPSAVLASLLSLVPALLPAQTLHLAAVGGMPFQNGICSAAAGAGVAVAVGEFGSIYASSDGTVWMWRETPVRADLQGVAWTGATFCAAGDGGTILTSPDGMVWTPRASGTTVNLAAVAAGGGKIVVAGDAGKVFTSTDGVAWAPAAAPVIERINGLAYGSGVFVAVTEAGGILTSPDATTWVPQTSPASGALSSLAFGSGVFVAVGSGGEILTSPDAIAWTVRRAGQMERLWCVAATGAGFVAVGSGGVVVQSSDGISWSAQAIAGAPLLRTVVQGTSGLFAISESGGLWSSADGSAWTRISPGEGAALAAVTSGAAGPFVAVGTSGTILTSPDGFAWTPEVSPTDANIEGVAFGLSKFVAVGSGGMVLNSADGHAWTAVASGSATSLHGVAHGAAGFVAVGQSGSVLHSSDGSAWSAASVPGARGDFLAVAYGNGLYVAVGQWGQIATSTDGTTWTLLPDDPSQKERWYDITGIAFSNGRFVTATHYATSFTSGDGSTWTKRSAAMVPGLDFYGAVPLGDGMAVFGDAGTIQLSSDGSSWNDIPRACGSRLRSAATRGNITVFVGDYGTILQGANLPRQTNWTAYHDTITQADNAANVTSGNQTSNTALVNFPTGDAIPGVTIRFAQTVGTSGGIKTDANTGNPVLGGDAAAIFGGIIGFGSQVMDLGKNTGTATITISGLTPGRIYDLSLFATRDNFSSQTKFVLGGAASFTPAHSPGYLAVGGSPSGTEVSMATGDGSTAAGRIARWSDIITSGTTLTVTVTSPAPATYSCLLPQAIRISEMTEPPVILAGPVSAEAAAGDALTLTSTVLGTGVTYQWYQRDVLGNVTAVPGATSRTLQLASLNESAQYFVRATASGGSVDSPAATVIALRTYEQWAAWKGIASSADTDDADADGLPNLVEYALGTDPSEQTASPRVSVEGSNLLTLSFRVSKESGGLAITAESSTTLADNSWSTASLQQLEDENFAAESWVASTPASPSRAFLRLRVSRQ
jgi:hypothetical protein